MRLPYFIALLGLLSGAFAVQTQKSVVVTFPEDTPDSVMDEAKKTITDAVSPRLPIQFSTLDKTANVLFRVAGLPMNTVSIDPPYHRRNC